MLRFEPSDRRLYERRIETGVSDRRYTEVISGLEYCDRVAFPSALGNAVDGARVIPAPR